MFEIYIMRQSVLLKVPVDYGNYAMFDKLWFIVTCHQTPAFGFSMIKNSQVQCFHSILFWAIKMYVGLSLEVKGSALATVAFHSPIQRKSPFEDNVTHSICPSYSNMFYIMNFSIKASMAITD